MTLRRRLELALALLTATLLVGGVVVLAVQRAEVVRQVDAQLRDLAGAPGPLLNLARRADLGLPRVQAPTDVYVGRVDRRGRLTTLLAPVDDPDLVPDLSGGVGPSDVPRTVATTSGSAARARMLSVDLPNGGRMVLAVPTTRTDALVARLGLALALAGLLVGAVAGLLVWWVQRLGLRPIAELTTAADEVSAGRLRRIDHVGPPGTEVARLGQALDVMVATTLAANEQMARFVADASHELRTPLTTIVGYSAAAGGAGDRAGAPGAVAVAPDDALRRIHEEAGRMGRLVEQLLVLSTQARVAPGDLRPVDLERVLHDVAADLRVVQPEREVGVHVEPGTQVPADPDLLRQAIVSLVGNAVQHTPGSASIHLDGVRRGDLVAVTVADTGPGIAPEHVPHLTERFYRVDPSRSRRRGGSGLGLAVVEAVAHAHHGRLVVRSEPGHGSRFTLELPAVVPD
ncbi:HAMP domain-containing sensor histidine kinase [Nocardioides korecus]